MFKKLAPILKFDLKGAIMQGYATKERCRTERKSSNLEYALGVRLTGFTT
jgi:hypothetical protein